MKTGTKIGLVALIIAVSAAMFWFHLTRQVNLPDDRTGFVLLFLGVAVLGVVAFFKGTSLPGAIPPAIAILIGLFLPFTMHISPQVLDSNKAIQVGDTIPHFTAVTGTGETFDSNALKDHLVLIKFFRAHW